MHTEDLSSHWESRACVWAGVGQGFVAWWRCFVFIFRCAYTSHDDSKLTQRMIDITRCRKGRNVCCLWCFGALEWRWLWWIRNEPGGGGQAGKSRGYQLTAQIHLRRSEMRLYLPLGKRFLGYCRSGLGGSSPGVKLIISKALRSSPGPQNAWSCMELDRF